MNEIQRPKRLVFIRHAESERNEAKRGSVYFADDEARSRIRGIPDDQIKLTPNGREQARATGIKLRETFGVPDYIYHSGYARTIETTDGVLEAYAPDERAQIRVRMNTFIRERDPGHTYDMTVAEAEATFPYLAEHWKTFGGFFARPPGGESLADVTNRVHTFLDTIFRDRAGQSVFVVSHGGTLRCLRFLLERWSYEKALRWGENESPKNCGVTDYEYDPSAGRLVLRNYNTVHWC